MADPVDIAELEKVYAAEIVRLNRMVATALTVASIEHLYTQLMESKFEASTEYFLMMEGVQTGLVMSYGRLFVSSDGTTRLQEKAIPAELRAVHEELMGFRNERYAHHGRHESKSSSVSLSPSEDGVLVNMSMEIGFWVGASKAWAPMFIWLRQHVSERIDNDLQHLSRKSGLRWHMAQGPAPGWIIESAAS